MKPQTFAVTLGLLFVLFAVGVLEAFQMLGSGGTLTEFWVSDTARDAIGNHHAPTATKIGNKTVVIAPGNAPQKVGDCALVAFNMELEEQWRGTVSPDACNIHAFGDPTVADLDDDGALEILVVYGDGRVVALSFDSG